MWFGLDPSAYPYGPNDRYSDMSLVSGVSASTAAAVALSSGVLSAGAAVLLLLRRQLPAWVALPLALLGLAMFVVFAFIVPDIQLLILAAYALTLAMPALAAFVISSRLSTRRNPTGGITAVRVGIRWAALTCVVTLAVMVGLGRPWTWDAGDEGGAVPYRPLISLASLAAGVVWGIVTMRVVRRLRGQCEDCGQPGPPWTTPEAAARWGRLATWATALAPLPYVLTRLTWLTPWPYGETIDHLAAHPSLWVFGLGLAVAGELGTWLTLSLITSRGEVFPRWIPVLAGTRVPVMLGVVPGLTIALLMCIAGHSIAQQAFAPGTTTADHLLVVLIPLPVWGPLLAASVVAYWYRRRPACHRATQRSSDMDPEHPLCSDENRNPRLPERSAHLPRLRVLEAHRRFHPGVPETGHQLGM